jgi:predicted secreted protein
MGPSQYLQVLTLPGSTPSWRKTPKRLRRQNADRQARHRAKVKAQDPEGFRRRKREENAARRARKRAANAAAAQGSVAEVVDLESARAQRGAEG